MKIRSPTLAVLIVVSFGLTLAALADEAARGQASIWSKDAIHLPEVGAKSWTLRSPNGRETIITHGYGFRVELLPSAKELPEDDTYQNGGLGDIGWAPDSKAFFVTQSDGGLVGDWTMAVFILGDAGVKQSDVSGAARRDFEKRYRCDEPEDAEIAAITWLDDSRKLLLLAEVPNHSSCPQMGMVRGYLVSVPDGKVIQQFDRKTLLRDWSGHMRPWVVGLLKDDSSRYGD